MIPGVKVEIDGSEYVFPPINLVMRREHKEFLARAQKFFEGLATPSNDDLLEVGVIVQRAFERNYSVPTFAALEPKIDDAKLLECFTAIMAAGRAGPPAGEQTPGSR